jgi:protein TonB
MAFEAVLAGERAAPKHWRRVMVAVSLGLHVAALAVGVAYSFWTIDELPLPAIAVTLVGGAPPPPPPPPPKRHSTGTKTKVRVDKPKTLVQPKEHPEEKPKPEEPEKSEEKDEEGATDDGQEGGVKGGVAGGVVGGVIGAPLQNSAPKMLTAQVGRALLLINPNEDPYIVRLPPPLVRAKAKFTALVYICVSAEGRVTSAKLVRSVDPAIDPQIPTVLGRWRYRPYMVDGRPTPFCWPLKYLIE